MAASAKHPRRSLHLRPTSRLTWVGLGLLLLSMAGFMYGVLAEGPSPILPPGDYLVLPTGIAAPLVILAAMAFRHERSVTAIGAIILAVLWLLLVRAFTAS
jgi:hypothetical protein